MPMMEIDKRLLDPNGEPELIENFNRVMQAVDKGGGSSVVVDATLSKSGQAADAKAAGDRIKAVEAKTTEATASAPGIMSAADKGKLDGIAEGANNYTHPAHTAHESGLYKVTVDAQGHVSNAEAATKVDITNLGIPAQDTTYQPAVANGDDGLLTGADKAKLDGIAANANNYALPAATTGALGGVRKSAAVAKAAADTVTQAEFNALIDALVAAGIMEAGA